MSVWLVSSLESEPASSVCWSSDGEYRDGGLTFRLDWRLLGMLIWKINDLM